MDPLDINCVKKETIFINDSSLSLTNEYAKDKSYIDPIVELVQVASKGCMVLDVDKIVSTRLLEDRSIEDTNLKVEPVEPLINDGFVVKQEDYVSNGLVFNQPLPTVDEDDTATKSDSVRDSDEFQDCDESEESDESLGNGVGLTDVSKSVTMTESNQQHIDNEPDNYKEVLILCGACDKTFSNNRLFDIHCQVQHKDQNVDLRCAYCGQTSRRLKNIVSLRCHHKFIHRLKARKCPHCEKIVCPKSFNKHVQKMHVHHVQFDCPVCQKIIYTPSGYKDHMERHFPENIKYKTCPICDKSIRQSYFAKHVRGHKKIEETFMCEVCGLLMRNRGNFKTHQQTHLTKISTRLCELCGKLFKTERLLKVHYKLHSGGGKVTCDICGAILSTMHSLKTHMLIHLEKRPYTCRFCEKGFRTSNNLKIHERIHTGERPFQCNICPSAFYGSANLNKHRRKVHCNGKTSNKKFRYDISKLGEFAEGTSDPDQTQTFSEANIDQNEAEFTESNIDQ